MRMKMNSKILLSYFLLQFALPLSAREKSDLLVMRNGDRLTCEIKSLSSNTLSISLDYASGTVSIDWGKVDHIESKHSSDRASVLEDWPSCVSFTEAPEI